MLINLSSLGKLLNRDATCNLLYSLLAQINSLIFSTYSKPNLPIASPVITTSPSTTTATATTITIKTSAQLKQSLTKYAVAMCKSGSFSNIVTHTIQHLTANKRLHADSHMDISYFLWLIKFFVGNFVLKRLEPSPPASSVSPASSMLDSQQQQQQSPLTHSRRHNNHNSNAFSENPIVDLHDTSKKMKFEKTFFNDTHLASAVATKRTLLSYDLLSFLSFSMLSNFERLLFESNAQNMTVLKIFTNNNNNNTKQHSSTTKTTSNSRKQLAVNSGNASNADSVAAAAAASSIIQRKLVNARSLNLFYLSISCVYEIIECINMHLEYLNSSQYQKVTLFFFYIKLNNQDFKWNLLFIGYH